MSDSKKWRLLKERLAMEESLEDQASLLIKWFHKDPPPTTTRERMEKLNAQTDFVPEGSLIFPALKWQRDPRTIRRWCQKKLLPEAKQPNGSQKGRHWRMPFQPRSWVKPRLEGFIRKPKSVLNSKQWKEVKAYLEGANGTAKLAVELDRIERDLAKHSGEKIPRRRKRASKDAFDFASGLKGLALGPNRLTLKQKRLAIETQRKTKLLWAVKTLKLANETPTWEKIARTLGISRATLHRRFLKKELQEALRRGRFNFVKADRGQSHDRSREIRKSFEEDSLKGGHRKRTTTNPKR